MALSGLADSPGFVRNDVRIEALEPTCSPTFLLFRHANGYYWPAGWPASRAARAQDWTVWLTVDRFFESSGLPLQIEELGPPLELRATYWDIPTRSQMSDKVEELFSGIIEAMLILDNWIIDQSCLVDDEVFLQ